MGDIVIFANSQFSSFQFPTIFGVGIVFCIGMVIFLSLFRIQGLGRAVFAASFISTLLGAILALVGLMHPLYLILFGLLMAIGTWMILREGQQ